MKSYTYIPSHPDTVGWKKRHLLALDGNATGAARPPALQQSVAFLIRGWCGYAEAHQHAYEDGIGEDHVLGDPWFAIGMAIRELLNGEIGHLDAGTLDTILVDNLIEQGYCPDLGERIKS